jgi:hypothetical protein
MYIRGSNLLPQSTHGINNLWKKERAGVFSPIASKLFLDWAFKSEVEVMLQGGSHADLEALHETLTKMPDLPSAKFNESMEALNGACTLVTFVASERVVAVNNHIRANQFNRANVVEKLRGQNVPFTDSAKGTFVPTEDEIFVASQVSFLSLAS